MKITIDTKEDSHEDIKKVVRMLEALLEGHIAAPMGMFGSPDSDGSSASSPGTDLFSLFDSSKAGDSGTVASVKTDENKDDDIPELVPY